MEGNPSIRLEPNLAGEGHGLCTATHLSGLSKMRTPLWRHKTRHHHETSKRSLVFKNDKTHYAPGKRTNPKTAMRITVASSENLTSLLFRLLLQAFPQLPESLPHICAMMVTLGQVDQPSLRKHTQLQLEPKRQVLHRLDQVGPTHWRRGGDVEILSGRRIKP